MRWFRRQGLSCCLLVEIELGRGGVRLGERLRAEEDTGDERPREQHPGEDVERRLEAVIEGDATRVRDPVCVGEVACRQGGDRAHRGDPDRAAYLPARVDEPRGDPRIGALDAGEARDRDRNERKPQAGSAEDECREQVPEVVAVDGQAGQDASDDADASNPAVSVARTPKRATTIWAKFDATTTGIAKPAKATPDCTAE